MTLKKSFKKYLGDSKKRKDVLYLSSKRFLMFMMFVFFGTYFAVSANYYIAYSSILFLPAYIAFVLSLVLYLCFAIWEFGETRIPKIVLWVFCVFAVAIGVGFLIPIF